MWIFRLIMILLVLLVVYLIFGARRIQGSLLGTAMNAIDLARIRTRHLRYSNGGTPKRRSAKRNLSASRTTF